jgi:alpha-tubulin suppressor-like RCC1 family protein
VTSYFGDQSLTANTVTMMSFTDRSGAALTETGNVWTWGTHDSTYKALGQASASSSSTPKQINFSICATGNITKITSRDHRHNLALDSSGIR